MVKPFEFINLWDESNEGFIDRVIHSPMSKARFIHAAERATNNVPVFLREEG
ncbi:hypothetical protein Scep_014581 [Stephania cephalantha]|uniref:Uncharacterized protein n=1 Tax=Stephania cephalantha TaxID=152367 RepID=A0AAP0J296_9MAGN